MAAAATDDGHIPIATDRIVGHSKPPERLPTVYGHSEVERRSAHLSGTPKRAAAILCGGGLRRLEAGGGLGYAFCRPPDEPRKSKSKT